MREPITTDDRISYVNAHNQLVVYDRPIKCALCNRCLADRNGHCMYGGPFKSSLAIVVASAILLTACVSAPPAPPEPVIVTRDVERIVRVRCADMRAPAPDFPDDDEDLAAIPAEDIFGLAQVYRAARTLYRQRLKEDDGQIAACAQTK